MKEFTAVTRALSDENRVRALLALRQGELCVCQIIAMLGLAPSTVSKHMLILKQAGLVQSRKQDRWIYYRLPGGKQTEPIIARMLRLCLETLAESPTAVRDSQTLARILKQDPEDLCRERRNPS